MTHGGSEEAALLARARQGDQEAYAELYRRHRNYVLRLAARFGIDGEEAHDLLQDAFIVFFRKVPTFEVRAKVTTYLYPTVKFLAQKRKRRPFAWLPLTGRRDAVQVPAGEPLRDSARRVVDMVSGLPEEQREVILLRYVDDMSLKDIAAALAIPMGTVKSRLFYALGALRKKERPGG